MMSKENGTLSEGVGWLGVLRPINMLMTFGAVCLGAYLASEWVAWEWMPVLSAAFAASLILAAGNVFNDLRDVESDRINHPERPLVVGTLSKLSAWGIVIIGGLAGLILAWAVSPAAFWVALFVVILLAGYSLYLKSVPVWGNLSVAVMAGMTFPFGGIALGSMRGTEYPAIFGLLFHFAREVVKDLEDREGDALMGLNTIAVKFGVVFPRLLICVVLGLLIIVTIIPFVTGRYGITYFLVALLGVDLLLVGMMWKLWTSEDPRSLRQVSFGLKAGMAIGLVAIVLG
jgi:geranylgeranylglycerol-phosphate geranylgeranyltransferase